MSIMTRIFNRLNGRIMDKDSNPDKESRIFSSVYTFRGDSSYEEIHEHMEATRNIDGSWEVVKYRMGIDKRDVGSAGYIPDMTAEVIAEETDIDTAIRLVRKYEDARRDAGIPGKSFDCDDHDLVYTVASRLEKARASKNRSTKPSAPNLKP